MLVQFSTQLNLLLFTHFSIYAIVVAIFGYNFPLYSCEWSRLDFDFIYELSMVSFMSFINKDIWMFSMLCTCSKFFVQRWVKKRKFKKSFLKSTSAIQMIWEWDCARSKLQKDFRIHTQAAHSILKFQNAFNPNFDSRLCFSLSDRCFIGRQYSLCVWISGFIFGNYVVTIVQQYHFMDFSVWFLGWSLSL